MWHLVALVTVIIQFIFMWIEIKFAFFCFIRCWILSSLFCQTVAMFSLFQRMCIVILVILRYSFSAKLIVCIH